MPSLLIITQLTLAENVHMFQNISMLIWRIHRNTDRIVVVEQKNLLIIVIRSSLNTQLTILLFVTLKCLINCYKFNLHDEKQSTLM